MATWPSARILEICSLAFAACFPSLFHSLALATSQTSIPSSQNEQVQSKHNVPCSPVDRALDGFKRKYVRGIPNQLGFWNVIQLVALCGLLGYFIIRGKRRATGQQDAASETSTATNMADKGARTESMKARYSMHDAQLTDPGLLKKHSCLRSYTTSFGIYPAIRVFKREHPQADKLPSKLTPLPLLVFIHGLGGSLAQFHPLLTSLVNVAPCLGIDLPGCGFSSFSPTTWAAYSQEALVELLAKVIAENCQRDMGQGVVLIGHSMGCALGALLASKGSPLRVMGINPLALIAICPKATSPTDRELALFRRLLYIPTPILDLWRRWDRRGGAESASVARFVGPGADIETKRLQLRFNIQSKSAVWRRMAWGLVCNDRTADLTTWARLSVPIFLIGGESDRMTSPNEVSAIANVLGNTKRLYQDKCSVSPSRSTSQFFERIQSADEITKASKLGASDSTESNTETTFLTNHHQSPGSTSDSPPSFLQQRQVCKTTILPAPASHSLLYDPTTYRTLAGLIQDFLWDYIDSRLSLGWQLQHLCTEGKWDVKNLAKWQAVRPVSEPIANIFRAMKTLREVDEEHCPEMFVRKWKGKLKAVIDISYENPVYDPRGLDNGGIQYHKFPTVSKIPPTADEVQDFIKLVDRIRHADSPTASADALIGIHCHYGFNRTGFFICSYLIENEHYGVQQAIDEFQAQRPPGIRHDHFLDTLFVRYTLG